MGDQEEWVSERFLQHETMRRFKKLRNYQKYCSRLGYESFTEEDMKKMERIHDLMIEKYGKEFEYSNGWEWIPSEIVKDRSLPGLAKYVKVDHFRPYYDLSSDGIHGGPKGLDHMGLPKHLQNRILLAGPSIFGMTDSLHSTAISLQRATLHLIKQEANSSNIIEMKAMEKIVDKIGQTSLDVHQDLEPRNRST